MVELKKGDYTFFSHFSVLFGRSRGFKGMEEAVMTVGVNGSVFREWFRQYFVPTLGKYCKDSNLTFKALLILVHLSFLKQW
jgi:hypothetical protein